MGYLTYTAGVYQTPPRPVSRLARMWPSLVFYSRFFRMVWRASVKARRGLYDDVAWCHSSLDILRALERVGVRMEFTGIDRLEQLDVPCVIVGNHMSLLETVVLPVIVLPVRDVTFIVKESLLDYPVFKHVMRTRDPIAVTRTNARQDLKVVLEGGRDRLDRGISIIVFPQTTRTVSFCAAECNTIGVKLAQRAGPVRPQFRWKGRSSEGPSIWGSAPRALSDSRGGREEYVSSWKCGAPGCPAVTAVRTANS